MISSSKTKATDPGLDGKQAASRQLSAGERVRQYYQLTKPGIVYGNCLTTAAGFLFASSFMTMGLASWLRFAATIAGTAAVIAAGCVLNNYLDRGIDSKMDRTKGRALVTGTIATRNALWFAGVLALVGIGLLSAFANITTVYVGLLGLYTYVVAYGIAKRRSRWGTLVGSVPGATPLVAGYTAVTGRLDLTAIMLFLTMAIWQMPHFYAIAIFRKKDYASAELPVWSVSRGIDATKRQIVAYVAAFVAAILALYVFGHASLSFTVIMTTLGLWWLYRGVKGLRRNGISDDVWAKGMFGYSLNVLLIFSLLLALNSFLP